MADSTSKTSGTRGKAGRSESEALKNLAARARSADEQSAIRSNPEEIAEENRRSLEAFVEANAAIMDGMAALSAEILAFGNKRLNANLERSQLLAACEDAEQAFRVHSEFFESAVRQYLDLANNLMTIMASMTRGYWQPLEEQTKETLEGLNRETADRRTE